MYTRQEASLLRKKFWTTFGQYMKPVRGATGDTINWLNYKTGIRQLYFRMDATAVAATIAIEISHTDSSSRYNYFDKLVQVKSILEKTTGESWQWEKDQKDEDGQVISRIYTTKEKLNIFNEADWPAIISFLKPRIIALDEFWMMVKDNVEY